MLYREEPESGLLVSEGGKIYREIKQWDDKYGYKYITWGRKNIPVHRLVAKVFRPGRNGKNDVVMHIDDNPHNNNADNLEWGTTAKNNDDAIEHGLRKNVYKVRCLETGEVYRSAREAAVKLWGKPKMGDSIIRCVKGERSKTRGLHWEVVGR